MMAPARHTPPDHDLAAAARRGSTAAFDTLTTRYYGGVLRYLSHQTGGWELAADLAREGGGRRPRGRPARDTSSPVRRPHRPPWRMGGGRREESARSQRRRPALCALFMAGGPAAQAVTGRCPRGPAALAAGSSGPPRRRSPR